MVALYALWQLAGNLSSGGYRGAIAHAWWVWHAERTLRLPSELAVQRLLLPHPLLSQVANLYYATMHFGMLIAMLVWLFARHRDGYPAVRNAVAASTAICLLISLVPVAPPRMLRRSVSWTWRRGTGSPFTWRSALPRARTSCPRCRRCTSRGRCSWPGP